MSATKLPIETFLNAQPRTVLIRLYEKPASCLAVFRYVNYVPRSTNASPQTFAYDRPSNYNGHGVSGQATYARRVSATFSFT